MWSTHPVPRTSQNGDRTTDGGVLGIDVGGTKILGIRVVNGEVADRIRVPSQGTHSGVVGQIESVIAQLIERSDAHPRSVGLGIAGFVGMDGVARSAPNTPGLIGVNLVESLSEKFGLDVFVNNDANCAAIAVAHNRPPSAGLLAITLGTGIGGGFVMDGTLIRGRHGYAAEPGHMVVDPNGPKCPCGNFGCWERFASGSGLGWLARRAADAGRGDLLIAAAGSTDQITGETVTALLGKQNPEAQAVFGEFIFYLALGVSNLIMLLDPQDVVISGGLAQLGDTLIEPLLECIKDQFPVAVTQRETSITVADLGEDAGAWGAALLAGAK